jgi:DNA-directed RNA polymerase subunit RPC12/RpoP
MKLEYSGDFASFDCEKCFRHTRIVIKDEELEEYFCAYCGHKMTNEMWQKIVDENPKLEERFW